MRSHQDVNGPWVEAGLFEPRGQAAELEAARVKAVQAQDLMRGNDDQRGQVECLSEGAALATYIGVDDEAEGSNRGIRGCSSMDLRAPVGSRGGGASAQLGEPGAGLGGRN